MPTVKSMTDSGKTTKFMAKVFSPALIKMKFRVSSKMEQSKENQKLLSKMGPPT